jgi:hypothetical protein
MNGNKIKVFYDAHGHFVVALAEYEFWIRFAVSYHPHLSPPCSISTRTVNVKLSSSYAELKEKIDAESWYRWKERLFVLAEVWRGESRSRELPQFGSCLGKGQVTRISMKRIAGICWADC